MEASTTPETSLEQLTAAALTRPMKERAALAMRLMESLDREPPDEDPWEDETLDLDDADSFPLHLAWREELKRRIEDLESGRVQGIPGEEVFAEVRRLVGR